VRALLLALVALSLGCANSDNSLAGSVSEFYPLSFATVRARLYDSELSIEYVRANGETVVRVTVRRDDKDPTGPGTIDLEAVGDITGSAGGVPLPPFVDGSLVFNDYRAKDGALVGGHFEGRLESGDARLSLSGTFDTRLDLVDDL